MLAFYAFFVRKVEKSRLWIAKALKENTSHILASQERRFNILPFLTESILCACFGSFHARGNAHRKVPTISRDFCDVQRNMRKIKRKQNDSRNFKSKIILLLLFYIFLVLPVVLVHSNFSLDAHLLQNLVLFLRFTTICTFQSSKIYSSEKVFAFSYHN